MNQLEAIVAGQPIPLSHLDHLNLLIESICPRCGTFDCFMPGPCGGLSQNVLCMACHAEFNVGPVAGELLYAACPEDRYLQFYRLGRHCRLCGCTQERECEGGCVWVAWDLCSRCHLLLIAEAVKHAQEQAASVRPMLTIKS